MPCSFITFFSSCFCVIITLGSASSHILWSWNLFLSSHVPHGLITCLSVCMPDLFSSNVPSLPFQPCCSSNAQGSFRNACLCSRSSFYLDGPVLGLPGNFLVKNPLKKPETVSCCYYCVLMSLCSTYHVLL